MLTASSPFSFILFGASGNLAKLKIYPSLYVLAMKKRFPEDYVIMGYARSEMSLEAFREMVGESVKKDLEEVNEKKLADFLSHVHYHQGAYDSEDDFVKLEKELQTLEKGWGERVRLAYLSVPPSTFNGIFECLRHSGISTHKEASFRCIVEKPVGDDLQSFEDVRNTLMKSFKEDEIYLLDHYLGKEAVRNVYYLRYANIVLENILKNALIHHVEIVADESAGIEGRAGYFESVGTLRDMFQSHLLEMCALLTMSIGEGGTIPAMRLNALEQLYLPPAPDLRDIILQGQYAKGTFRGKPALGYQDEKDVAKDSRTNTFVALKLMSRMANWQGVPFYLRSGKRVAKKETRISVQFQMPQAVEGGGPNRLDIILQGEAGMRLHLQTKLGGSVPMFRPLIMEDPLVCVGDCLPEHAVLLLEAIHGKREWYLSFDEVRTAWRLIDPLQACLEKKDTPLHLYEAGAKGPEEMESWIARDGISWM